MTTDTLLSLARHTKLAISLTADPDAQDSERWVASVGLEALAAGPTPDAAISEALRELVDSAASAVAFV